MNYDAGDPSKVKDRKTAVDLQNEREIEELKWLLQDRRGRNIIWRLMEVCGVFRTSFTGNSQTFFNEGKRQIGLHLIGEVFKADANAFALMQVENKKDEDE